MSPLAAILFIALSLLIFYVPYYFTSGFRKYRFSKYIPALICFMVIAVFAVRFMFFQVGYSGIVDVIVIGHFSFMLVIFIITAVFHNWLFNNKKGSSR